MPNRRALYDFISDPRDLAEHEEEFRLYRWGAELEKYLAAQIVNAIGQASGHASRSLESLLLRFVDGDTDRAERLNESQTALKQAAGSGSGWIKFS